ncbi:hypothetical protein, partial [Actinomadura roseirufa]|uniref:hypothetical protein n=1 Tax=Actinomadura roseirufa TaxID=2094049 RepID=UPI0013F15257
MPLRPLAAVLAFLPALLLPAASACGREREIVMPPLTPEPGDSRLADAPGPGSPSSGSRAAGKGSLPARLVLYRYLRGVAAGDVRACAHLAPAYERAVFGGPGRCRAGLP